jgi:hypothetical protein
MEDGDGEEADDLLDVVIGSAGWEMVDMIQGFYVLARTQNSNYFPNLLEN